MTTRNLMLSKKITSKCPCLEGSDLGVFKSVKSLLIFDCSGLWSSWTICWHLAIVAMLVGLVLASNTEAVTSCKWRSRLETHPEPMTGWHSAADSDVAPMAALTLVEPIPLLGSWLSTKLRLWCGRVIDTFLCSFRVPESAVRC